MDKSDESPDDYLLFGLDSPKFHRVRFGEINRFAGMVFDSRDLPIERLRARLDGEPKGEIPADLPSEDIARHLPHLSTARRCRFDASLFLERGAELLAMEAVGACGDSRPLFEYDLAEVRRSANRLAAMSEALERVPAPPGDIVFFTQGHSDSAAYQDSIIPGVVNARRYLSASGIDPDAIGSILDFGCGSGRLLAGWHLDDPHRELRGCDTNAGLIAWAEGHLPAAMRFSRTSLDPPLPYAAGSFDLVSVISVFTHLGFTLQERWVAELRRVIAPRGVVLITLHGIPYINLFLADRREEFRETGRIELARAAEGSNDFTTFHSASAVRGLFPGFELLENFPAGRVSGRPILFPLAAFQDVFVLRALD